MRKEWPALVRGHRDHVEGRRVVILAGAAVVHAFLRWRGVNAPRGTGYWVRAGSALGVNAPRVSQHPVPVPCSHGKPCPLPLMFRPLSSTNHFLAVHARDDLEHFGGDVLLAQAAVALAQAREHLAGILGGAAHRELALGMFRGGTVMESVMDHTADVFRQQTIDQRLRGRLDRRGNDGSGSRRTGGRSEGGDRQQLPYGNRLTTTGDEIPVKQMHVAVHAAAEGRHHAISQPLDLLDPLQRFELPAHGPVVGHLATHQEMHCSVTMLLDERRDRRHQEGVERAAQASIGAEDEQRDGIATRPRPHQRVGLPTGRQAVFGQVQQGQQATGEFVGIGDAPLLLDQLGAGDLLQGTGDLADLRRGADAAFDV